MEENKEELKDVVIEETVTKPKILWVSDLVTPTGFSRVAHSVIANIKDKYDIVGLGINYRGDPHNFDFPIYPASAGGRVFGEDRLLNILNGAEFDMVFILNDAWVVNSYLHAIKTNLKKKLPKIVVYFPVDSESHDPSWYSNFDIVTRSITYTEFGKNVVNEDDCAPNLKLDIIPHGVNADNFYKKFTNRRDAKKAVFGNSKDPNSFILLNANRNQPRKRLDVTMQAFKIFAEGKDDVLLHMHCGVRDASIDVARMATRLGIDSKLILTNLNPGVQMVSDSALNDIYNAADVGLNSSMGEGWGLTAMEHALTGAAQIVPNHSSCSEIFFDCGLLVKPIMSFTFDGSMTVGKLISPQDMAEKMNELYFNRYLCKDLGERAMKKFSEEKFSWKDVSKSFDRVFLEALNSDADIVS